MVVESLDLGGFNKIQGEYYGVFLIDRFIEDMREDIKDA